MKEKIVSKIIYQPYQKRIIFLKEQSNFTSNCSNIKQYSNKNFLACDTYPKTIKYQKSK